MSDGRSQVLAEQGGHFTALPAGFVLGKYRLNGVLGHGGFGITYRALDLELGRPVAIKEYLPADVAVRLDDATLCARSREDQESFDWGLTRFLDEARALARFENAPSIVRVHDYLQTNGTAYMVMALVEGMSLWALYRQQAQLGEAQLKNVLLPLLSGLEQVHAAHFLHRDIKPSNILLRANGFPVLIDFGAARQALGERSRSITSVFTPGYAPFEQYMSNGQQGPWTDIYALAATIYQGITGNIPPPAPDRMRRDEMVPAVEAGAGRYARPFLAAIDRGLAVFEDARPQSVAEWRALLLAEDKPQKRAARPAARRGLAVAAGLGVALAAAGGGYALWSGIEQERRELAEKVKAEAEIRDKAEENAREQGQRAVVLRQEEDARRLAAERLEREQAEARRRAEEEAQRRAEEEARAAAERQRQEAAAKAEAEAKAKADAEAKAKAEAEAKAKAEADAKAKTEADAKRKAEEDAKAREAAQRVPAAAPAPVQTAAATPAVAESARYVGEHWGALRRSAQGALTRHVFQRAQTLSTVDSYEIVSVSEAKIVLRVTSTVSQSRWGSGGITSFIPAVHTVEFQNQPPGFPVISVN